MRRRRAGTWQQPLKIRSFLFSSVSKHADFPGQLRSHRRVKSAKQQEELFDMGKKCFVMALAVFAFGFGTQRCARTPAQIWLSLTALPRRVTITPPPPPRPVVYVPPVRFGVAFGPAFGGYYGPRFGFYGGHRFYGRHASLGRSSPSLALSVEAAVSAATQGESDGASLNGSPALLPF